MLNELNEKKYSDVKSLFNNYYNQIVIGSVIEQNTPGYIYVDNKDAPSFSVIWDKMGEIIVTGKLTNDNLNAFEILLKEILIPDAKIRGFPFFDVYYPNENWAKPLKKILLEYSPQKKLRYTFEFSKKKFNSDTKVNMINKEILNNDNLKNIDSVRGWIDSFWHTRDEFLNKGIGFCIIDKDNIASWCLSVFISQNKCELGLQTVKQYENRGFAKTVANECIKYCLKKSLIPVWNCNADNPASVHVAKSVGFQKLKSSYIYEILI